MPVEAHTTLCESVAKVRNDAPEHHESLPSSLSGECDRVKSVYIFVRDYIRDNGTGPTNREISEALGFNLPQSAVHPVKRLLLCGALYKSKGRHRGLRLASVDVEQEPCQPRISPRCALSLSQRDIAEMAEAIVREVYGDTPPPAPAIPLRGAGA